MARGRGDGIICPSSISPAFLMSHPVPAFFPAGRRRPSSRASEVLVPLRRPRPPRANFWHPPPERASELRRAPPRRAGAEPSAAGEEGAAPAQPPSPAPRQPRRNRDHKYAERRLRAAQPARRPPRVLSRRRRARRGPSRERVRVHAAAGRQHPGPHARTSEVAARHATGPEAPRPPLPHPDGHRTHPSTCSQRHLSPPGAPRGPRSPAKSGSRSARPAPPARCRAPGPGKGVQRPGWTWGEGGAQAEETRPPAWPSGVQSCPLSQDSPPPLPLRSSKGGLGAVCCRCHLGGKGCAQELSPRLSQRHRDLTPAPQHIPLWWPIPPFGHKAPHTPKRTPQNPGRAASAGVHCGLCVQGLGGCGHTIGKRCRVTSECVRGPWALPARLGIPEQCTSRACPGLVFSILKMHLGAAGPGRREARCRRALCWEGCFGTRVLPEPASFGAAGE